MREREDANRTREAGNRDEVEGVIANTLNSFPSGAVGFIVWLDRRSGALNEQDIMSLRIVEYGPCIGAAMTAPDHAISANSF